MVVQPCSSVLTARMVAAASGMGMSIQSWSISGLSCTVTVASVAELARAAKRWASGLRMSLVPVKTWTRPDAVEVGLHRVDRRALDSVCSCVKRAEGPQVIRPQQWVARGDGGDVRVGQRHVEGR